MIISTKLLNLIIINFLIEATTRLSNNSTTKGFKIHKREEKFTNLRNNLKEKNGTYKKPRLRGKTLSFLKFHISLRRRILFKEKINSG